MSILAIDIVWGSVMHSLTRGMDVPTTLNYVNTYTLHVTRGKTLFSTGVSKTLRFSFLSLDIFAVFSKLAVIMLHFHLWSVCEPPKI